MQAQHGEFSIRSLCRTLEVLRSGYDEWRNRPPQILADANQQVQAKGQHYFGQGRGTYGTRRMKPLLAQEGLQVRRRRIGCVLAQAGLRCKTRRKCKAPRDSEQAQTIAPNQRHREWPDYAYGPWQPVWR
jgi:transposase InsO family protein